MNQFRLPHSFLARFRAVLDAELPEVAAALQAAGGLRRNFIRDVLPAEMTGGWRDGDERYEVLTGRRPVVEAVLAAQAEKTPGWRFAGVRRSPACSAGPGRCPALHTWGADEGWRVHPGRPRGGHERAAVSLAGLAAGDRRPPCRRGSGGQRIRVLRVPLPVGGRVAAHHVGARRDPLGHHHLPHHGRGQRDLGSRDRDRLEPALTAAARAGRLGGGGAQHSARCAWLDGTPIEDGVQVMARLEDRYRGFVVDGMPVATGVVAVADSWACSNPAKGAARRSACCTP